jgi:hypothetical protein
MCDLTVQFYTTSQGKQCASIMDTHQVIYVSQAEALDLLAGKEYQIGHASNPFRAVLAARMAESDKQKLAQLYGR